MPIDVQATSPLCIILPARHFSEGVTLRVTVLTHIALAALS